MTRESPLRIGGVPEHFNLPWQLSLEAARDAGTNRVATWTEYANGTGAMLADLADGTLDLAVLLTEGAALGLARGVAIEALTLYTTSPLIWGVHVSPASGFRTIDALQGARFAISRHGSGSHLMSLALATERGWPTTGMAFEIVDNLPGAITAFEDGRADVFLWEHFTTQPVVDQGAFRRVGDFAAPWPAWVLCARQAILKDRRGQIERLFADVCRRAGGLAAAADSVVHQLPQGHLYGDR
jgi:ABC-type nitrate/sulfonate/bicarbonate transport system substrate-binding protein